MFTITVYGTPCYTQGYRSSLSEDKGTENFSILELIQYSGIDWCDNTFHTKVMSQCSLAVTVYNPLITGQLQGSLFKENEQCSLTLYLGIWHDACYFKLQNSLSEWTLVTEIKTKHYCTHIFHFWNCKFDHWVKK